MLKRVTKKMYLMSRKNRLKRGTIRKKDGLLRKRNETIIVSVKKHEELRRRTTEITRMLLSRETTLSYTR